MVVGRFGWFLILVTTKFPHSPILHYAYSSLFIENNTRNNRAPVLIHSDEAPTLETSVFESFTMANLPYRPYA